MASYFTRENLKSSIMNQSQKVGNLVKSTADSARTRWKESSTISKVCIIGGGAAIAAPLAIIPALGVVGFTSAGVAAGSIAASMQTATTVSGSLFALCQSAGAVGAVAASTSAGVGLVAGATAGGVTAAVCKTNARRPNNDDNELVEDEDEDEDDQGVSNEQSDSVNGIELTAGASAGSVTVTVCKQKPHSLNNDDNNEEADVGEEEEHQGADDKLSDPFKTNVE
ncbi:unnamed protein product [Rotaria socialis]|uniref:Uncharacterized protein n=1 Tax=Rotaria socialis TaxID=392032 RepID=A0A820JGQ0_9BILA|nr:unnamed protein product [Rotaria socialis]CAF3509472.1 unnamed protein product [Rotaria socialis]CAF3564707.1 unnamed protein product [Rotaria socialis]CAF4168065.1 unnamed protein product [Rotaria socialis]CAF4280074.1 unnamed protein product [Rotaria socialis]